MLAILCLCVFAGLLLWAAVCDLATMEIPNRISILMAALYPVAAFACGQNVATIGVHLVTGLIALAVCFALFQLGVFGGGDAKVIAAASIWTGPVLLPLFLLWTALAGGALAAATLGARAAFKPADGRSAAINRLLSPDRGVPYAVAIQAGAMMVLGDAPLAKFAAA